DPNYLNWNNATNLVLARIKATVSPLQPLLISCQTASEAWDLLSKLFTSSSKNQIQKLKNKLNSITKQFDQSMVEYLLKAMTILISLQSTGSNIMKANLNDHIVDDLGLDYRSFV
ncbi:UBN2 domain-containing protein, partial [Cephalotus follicularis]